MTAATPITAEQACADQLAALHPRSITQTRMPQGTPVDPCRFCYLDDPEPAIVGIYSHDGHIDVCLLCALDATEQQIIEEGRGYGERIRVEILLIDNPSVNPYPEDTPTPQPGRVTVMDNDGTPCSIDHVGSEVFVYIAGRMALRFDTSTLVGLSASKSIEIALHDAIKAA